MSYQVLARKWRPRSFDEVVGQQHVLRALRNALDHDRLHHAYLFTGTRGVGKTTLARILAKCMNCEAGVSSAPCEQCSSCRELNEGRFVDLIEVDAASRTKVDETRELLENVQYSPTKGRFKIYLVDEVHMFSNHSFNALLKTLEEPPPHVKFLLATTDPKRIPVTILSRCLQFNLKRLDSEAIAGHLQKVLSAEGADYEVQGLERLARAADGSIRDALSLLDQALAFGGGAVKAADVDALLGDIGSGAAAELLERVAAGDGAALLERLAEHAALSPDYGELLNDILRLLQQIAVRQLVPDAAISGEWDGAVVDALAARLSPEFCQLLYQIAVTGRRDLAFAPDPRAGFEMTLLRMLAFRREAPERASAGAPEAGAAAPCAADDAAPAAGRAEPAAGEVAARPLDHEWASTVAELGLQGLVLELANNCVLVEKSAQAIRLSLAPDLQQLRNSHGEARLRQALSERFGADVGFTLEVAEPAGASPAALRRQQQAERRRAAEQSLEQDPQVSALLDAFDGRIDEVAVPSGASQDHKPESGAHS